MGKNNFDELMKNGELTNAARLFANQYYESGKIGHTRKLLIEQLADKVDHYENTKKHTTRPRCFTSNTQNKRDCGGLGKHCDNCKRLFKPSCFNPNKEAYPLCIGDNKEDCKQCMLWEHATDNPS